MANVNVYRPEDGPQLNKSELTKFKEFVEASDMLDINKQIVMAAIRDFKEHTANKDQVKEDQS